MKNTHSSMGHPAALITIIIWGTTFISTKLLLAGFAPVEILFVRFLLGFLALAAAYPHRLTGTTKRQECTFALAGLCGVCLYYLLENIALTYTLAANVGVIISVAPLLTALLTRLLEPNGERLCPSFFMGFAAAMAGICLIGFEGVTMALNPAGDLLALAAAFVWACYSILTKRISSFGYSTIQTTRRTFAYGLIFMTPVLLLSGVRLDLERFSHSAYLLNLLYLGFGASALCFVTWSYAVKLLGPVKTSVYIYLVPVITVITSMLVLHEELSPMTALGAALTLAGLLLSEQKQIGKERDKEHEPKQ